jgi:hypothetical protein
MRYVLILCFLSSLLGRPIINMLMERAESKFLWSSKGGNTPHELVVESHARQLRSLEDIRTGLTYILYLSVVLFAVDMALAA